MQSRRKLRFRLIVSFALFGFGLSVLFAVFPGVFMLRLGIG